MFRECCWENKGLKNQEWVHVNAFNRAIRETRWKLGRWGWWSFGGSEEQILSDLIADQIEWAVMGPIWCKLKGPYIIRDQIAKRIRAGIDTAGKSCYYTRLTICSHVSCKTCLGRNGKSCGATQTSHQTNSR